MMDAMSNVPAKLQAELDAELKRLEGEDGAQAVETPTDDLPDGNNTVPFDPPDNADDIPTVDDPALPSFDDDDGAGADGHQAQQDVDLRAQLDAERHRNEVLNGKYLAEVPRLNNRLKVAEDENTRLKAENADLKAKLAQTGAGGANQDSVPLHKQDVPKSNDPVADYELTEQESEYGPDVISMAEKIARKIVDREIGPMRGDVTKFQQSIQQQRQAQLVGDLTSLVSDWQTLNASTQFADFCDAVEPNSGLTNQEILDRAQASGDPVRIASVFQRFKNSSTSTASGSKPSGGPTAVEKQVMPGAAPTPPRADGKRTYTLREYESLMDNITKGYYPPEKAEKMRRDLLQAGTEGRIK
jgi:hypothetical protein